jgi:FKBP-type peptidyl-prolyl cis-trans isomerase (trigger factor)
MIPSIDDVYPPESPTKLRGRPIPELGVVNDEREKSVEEWMLDMLPKEIREAMKQFLRNYNQEEYWRRFKEFYLAEHPNATPRMIQKQFEKLWQKMQEIYIRTRANDPDGEGTYENLDKKLRQIWFEYFGFEEADPFEINPDIMI